MTPTYTMKEEFISAEVVAEKLARLKEVNDDRIAS